MSWGLWLSSSGNGRLTFGSELPGGHMGENLRVRLAARGWVISASVRVTGSTKGVKVGGNAERLSVSLLSGQKAV